MESSECRTSLIEIVPNFVNRLLESDLDLVVGDFLGRLHGDLDAVVREERLFEASGFLGLPFRCLTAAVTFLCVRSSVPCPTIDACASSRGSLDSSYAERAAKMPSLTLA